MSLDIAEELGDRDGAYQRQSDITQAMHIKSLDIVKEVENKAGEGRAYGNLGNFLS